MKEAIRSHLMKTLVGIGVSDAVFGLEYPENSEHGDFSTNAAMASAKKLAMSPKALAEKIVAAFADGQPDFIQSVSIAGPGFINFKIKDEAFTKHIIETVRGGAEYGWNSNNAGKKVMVEYTDPNPFKIFHIGHLMSNAIGESISRLIQGSGAEVVRACYQGDVGLHVAKTVWAMMEGKKEKGKEGKIKAQPAASATLVEKVQWLGDMYVYGSSFEEDAAAQEEIKAVNKSIFQKSDPAINELYEQGRKWSLEYFDTIYARLGTKFDRFFFESEVADDGVKIVREFLGKGVFQESEGAIVFKGEDHGLHTRVFVSSQGLPTYEAKELGLNTKKFQLHPDLSESIIITANEVNDYFKVVLKAFSLINTSVASKTKHISHGILRFASGKMSSRKGNIISADSLLGDIQELVLNKIADREFSAAEKAEIADIVAIGAIKYTILRQAIGGDVIFDSSASISFEGDSGPYLQYATVRANAVLEKAKEQLNNSTIVLPESVTLLERLISRFPDVVAYARETYGPQHIASYLMALAGAFNAYYANNFIVDEKDPMSPYRVALTRAFVTTMTNGLWLLGIKVPKRM